MYSLGTIKKGLIGFVVIVLLWVITFMVAPLAFQGSTFDTCSAQTCTTISTTRWYWLGGYHLLFGPEGPHYPAIIKYWPTSSWEIWLLLVVSLALAYALCMVGANTIPKVFAQPRKGRG